MPKMLQKRFTKLLTDHSIPAKTCFIALVPSLIGVDVVGCVHDGVDQGQDKGEVAEGRLLA